MAMTKAERAEMERLREELALARALRYSGMQAPTMNAIPTEGVVNGWSFNAYTGGVERMWSEPNAHGYGAHPGTNGERHASRDGRRTYATRREALIGLRLATEEQCAKKLAAIDALISREMQP